MLVVAVSVQQDVSSKLVAATADANRCNAAAGAEHLESAALQVVLKVIRIVRVTAINTCHLLHLWDITDLLKMHALAIVADSAWVAMHTSQAVVAQLHFPTLTPADIVEHPVLAV